MNDYIRKLLASAFILSNCVPLPNKMFNLVMQDAGTYNRAQLHHGPELHKRATKICVIIHLHKGL